MPQILDSSSGVTSINGVPADQLRNVYNTLNRTGDFNALDVVNDTIYNIPPTNTNPNRLIGDIATGKSNIIDAIDDVPTLPGRRNGVRLGSRIGSVLGVLGVVGDVGGLYHAGTVFQ